MKQYFRQLGNIMCTGTKRQIKEKDEVILNYTSEITDNI